MRGTRGRWKTQGPFYVMAQNVARKNSKSR